MVSIYYVRVDVYALVFSEGVDSEPTRKQLLRMYINRPTRLVDFRAKAAAERILVINELFFFIFI